MHPRTEVIQSGKVRNLDVTESLTYQGTAFVPSAATDEKSKVSSNDTTAGYLNGKLVAGTNITLTENNNGGNETLTISAAGGGGGTTGFTPTQNVAAPNATINASRLLVDVATSSGDAVLQPKGFGAVMAQLPDSTSTGGNKRGSYAVDWQMHRATADQVASGNYSVVLGGSSNKATQDYSVVGGRQNTVTAYSAIAAGYLNQTQNTYCFIGAGQSNTASGDKSSILGGFNNLASGASSAVLGGEQNTASGTRSVVLGGSSNTASGTLCVAAGEVNNIQGNLNIALGQSNTISSGSSYSIAMGGHNAVTTGQYNFTQGYQNTIVSGNASALFGMFNDITDSGLGPGFGFGLGAKVFGSSMIAHTYGYFNVKGDCQQQLYVQIATTSGATTQSLDNGDLAGNYISIQPNTTNAFEAIVTARRTDVPGSHAGWIVRGLVADVSGVTSIIGTPSITSVGNNFSPVSPTVAVIAGSYAAIINVTGVAGATIRWGANVNVMAIQS